MTYTNSSLVSYTKISPNRSVNRNHTIDKITIHHMAGNLSIETCGNVFASSSRQASANYGIGSDGRIGMYVEEKDRAWTSSNAANDNRAVTIEVANSSTGGDWPVSEKAYASLIKLCVDICKRNGIKKLNYTGDKSGNLTMHCWFAATGCPGPYLKARFADIANKVNAQLGQAEDKKPEKPTEVRKLYRVRKTWSDASSQLGAFEILANAKAIADKHLEYSVFDEAGKVVYTRSAPAPKPAGNSVDELAREVIAGKWGNGDARKKALTAAGYEYSTIQARVNAILKKGPQSENSTTKKITKGSTVRVNRGARTYTGVKLASFVYNRNHIVSELSGDRAVITYGGVVVAAVNVNDLTLV